MTNQQYYLIDANSLITPHLTYYPFDFAPSFWSQMEDHIESGRIVILDMVKSEILNGNDNLRTWMENLEVGTLIDHREPAILRNYSSVLQYVQNQRCYKPSALQEWSRGTVADAWIIATAMKYGYTIVTFEKPVGNLSDHNPSKNAKIPDVANALFNANIVQLYDMMRVLDFRL